MALALDFSNRSAFISRYQLLVIMINHDSALALLCFRSAFFKRGGQNGSRENLTAAPLD
jgi:hypothetical protein